MMAIRFACICGKRYQVKDSAAGHKATCNACGLSFRVPGMIQAPNTVFMPASSNPVPKPKPKPAKPPVARPSIISYPCPHCDSTLEIGGEHAGQEATCGVCQERTIVPVRSKVIAAKPVPQQSQAPSIPSYASVTVPMLISAITNLFYGIILTCFVVGIPMLILSYFEYRLYSESDTLKPSEFLRRARTIGAFEVVSGLLNWFGLFCGILVLINSGKIERRERQAALDRMMS
jgi:hypothetical protein